MKELALDEINMVSGASHAGYMGALGATAGTVITFPLAVAAFTAANVNFPLNPKSFQLFAFMEYIGAMTGAAIGVYIGNIIDNIVSDAKARKNK